MWVNLCSMRQSQRHFRADSATKPSSEAPQQGQGLESICFLEGKSPLKSKGVPASTSLQWGMQSHGNILSLMVPHAWLPCARGKLGFCRAVAPLTRHHGAGEATAVLPSLWRSWATGSVPGALPVPAPPAPRAARHWHTAVPTWVGENIIKHCQPSQDTRQGGRTVSPHPPLGQSGRGDSHEHIGAGAEEEEEVVKICLQSHPWGGNLFQGPCPAPSLPGLGWGAQGPVRSLPSLCSHGVALEVLEAGAEVQEPAGCSHTCGDRGALLGLGIPGNCWSCVPAVTPADGA